MDRQARRNEGRSDGRSGRPVARARRLAAAAIAIGAGVVAAVAGCSDTLMRETVLASTQTLIGVEVAQDARTNLYQGRAGYARQELFLVPTSKRVVNEGESGEAQNDPGSTPEVLGEIMADGVITPPGASEPARISAWRWANSRSPAGRRWRCWPGTA